MIKIIIVLLTLFSISLYTNAQMIKPKAEIVPYIEFIDKGHLPPKDYVLSLFDDHDIVVLSEGQHAEMYQYDLINDIISDPRFADKVGNVITEIGVVNMTDNANEFLHGSYLPSEADSLLGTLYRNIDYSAVWNPYNFYLYLKRIYELNQRLSSDKKISVHFTDVPFKWTDTQTREQYERFETLLNGDRDSIIGINAVNAFEKIRTQPRKKALVIFNRPHSITLGFPCYDDGGDWISKHAAYYLKEKYGDKVTSVLLNTLIFGGDGSSAIANGKWDAAFYARGYPPMGFELKDSPFGSDLFNFYRPCWKYRGEPFAYQDVFDSFVYYKSPKDQLCMWGIPEVVDWDTFISETFPRELMVRPEGLPEEDNAIRKYWSDYYGKLHVNYIMSKEYVEDYTKYMREIDQWFEVK